jgi:hypothetical protein
MSRQSLLQLQRAREVVSGRSADSMQFRRRSGDSETSVSSDGRNSFHGSDTDSLSNCYSYTVGPFAHAKSEGQGSYDQVVVKITLLDPVTTLQPRQSHGWDRESLDRYDFIVLVLAKQCQWH